MSEEPKVRLDGLFVKAKERSECPADGIDDPHWVCDSRPQDSLCAAHETKAKWLRAGKAPEK